MLFFMSSMSYCLLPPTLPCRSNNAQSSSCSKHYTGLLINIHIFVIKFWVPRLSPPSLQPALLFCVYQNNPTLIHLLLLMILLRWHLIVMTGLALANREKGVLSVNIVTSWVTRLTSVMHYMSVNIEASQVTRLAGVMHCLDVLLALL